MKKFLSRDPLFLVLLATLLLLPLAQVKWTFFGLPLYLPEIALLIALGLRIRIGCGVVSFRQFFLRDSLATWGIGLFVFGATLSTLLHPLSLTTLGMLKSWFFFPLLAAWLFFAEALDSLKRQRFLWGWFVALALTALGNLAYVPFGVLTFDGRLAGVYPSPNFLAFFIAPAVLLALYLDSSLKDSQNLSWKRIFLFLGVLGVVACLFFTRSYGVWGALFFATAVFLIGKAQLFGLRRVKSFLLILFLGGVVFFFLEHGSAKWQALTSFESRSSLSSRMMIWQASWKMFQDQPLLGIGLGRFQEVYLQYQAYFPPYLEWAVPEPHNWYLAVILNTGLLGLLGFVLLIGRLVVLTGKTWLLAEQKEKRLPALFFGSFLLLFFIYGLTDTPYFKNDLALTFFLLMALGFAQAKEGMSR